MKSLQDVLPSLQQSWKCTKAAQTYERDVGQHGASMGPSGQFVIRILALLFYLITCLLFWVRAGFECFTWVLIMFFFNSF